MRKIIITIVVLLLIGAAVFWLSKGKEAPTSTTKEQVVARHTIRPTVYGSGYLQCAQRAEIKTAVEGKLITLLVSEGDTVTASDTVAVLDHEDIENNVNIARGEVAELEEAYEKLQNKPDASEKLAAEVRLEEATSAHEQLQQELQHKQKLYDQGLGGTPRELTELNQKVTSAEKNVKIAQEQLTEASSPATEVQLAAALSRLNQAQLQLKELQNKLEAQNVKTPISGTVLRRSLDPDQIRYTPDRLYPEGTDLYLIGDLTSLMCKGTVFESDIRKISAGQAVSVSLNPAESQGVSGTVERVSLTPQATGDSVRFEVDIVFDTPPAQANEGLRVDFKIITAEAVDVIAVPVEFVYRDAKGPYVLVKSGTSVTQRPVTLGLSDDNYHEVKTGLALDDIVVWTAAENGE